MRSLIYSLKWAKCALQSTMTREAVPNGNGARDKMLLID